MTTLKPLLARNRSWALQKCQHDPEYFEKLVAGQRPHSLWIGCSDSRVPAEVLTGSHPGELFVHRNIANMIDPSDDNFMSVLQYALHYLEVERVVLCGHYGCGGVQAAFSLPEMPLAHESSALARRIGSLRDTLQGDIADLTSTDTDADAAEALNALVEANVRAQFSRLLDCDPVQTLLASGRPLSLHGCVYDLASGHLTTLVEHLSPQEHAP
ncbi:carbonic anhydrase [Klebsiella aerogenes]|uniref:carbonic anhydrase n=1 Tax=Klebsiella aerogenes TaxID=548 RepID=UPI001259CA0E|nr:carbonic anhydrase [Klebsiella aerogenes]VAG21706.1 Carbonic anhydrase [Klebsiella aerogenes]HEO9678906.1 carbonic anhydrase [Klebsiella aerogenes]